jgi:hypothetical protein
MPVIRSKPFTTEILYPLKTRRINPPFPEGGNDRWETPRQLPLIESIENLLVKIESERNFLRDLKLGNAPIKT